MRSLKTTVILFFVLIVSVLSCFWSKRSPAPGAFTASAPVPPPQAPAIAQGTPVTTPLAAPPPDLPRLERMIFRLNTTKTAEEQRLYDLKLFRALQEAHVPTSYSSTSTDTQAEELSAKREAYFQEAHDCFCALEDYILNTDFNALNDEEIEKLYQYYDVLRRIDEARGSYFDIPVEEWVALAKEASDFYRRREFLFLMFRQLQHEKGPFLGDALLNYRTFIHEGDLSFSAGKGVVVHLHGYFL